MFEATVAPTEFVLVVLTTAEELGLARREKEQTREQSTFSSTCKPLLPRTARHQTRERPREHVYPSRVQDMGAMDSLGELWTRLEARA